MENRSFQEEKSVFQEMIKKIESGEYSCILADDEGVRFAVSGKGIYPLVKLYRENAEKLSHEYIENLNYKQNDKLKLEKSDGQVSGLCAFDKVVGRAAASFFCALKVKSVYAMLMSAGAKAMLEGAGIVATGATITDEILNQDRSDICPMEKLTKDLSASDSVAAVLKFFVEKGL